MRLLLGLNRVNNLEDKQSKTQCIFGHGFCTRYYTNM